MQSKNKPKLQHLFPDMAKHPHWVGVAFLKGEVLKPYDALIMASTLGRFVHTELLVGQGANCRAYSSYNYTDVQSGFTQSINAFDPKNWEILTVPMTSSEHAQALALQLLDAQLPYNEHDLWQCCVKAMLPFESEVDCDSVQTWKPRGVFCSQMCLLVLRHLLHCGVFDKNAVPSDLQHNLHAVHSRGCSPNMLHALLKPHFEKI